MNRRELMLEVGTTTPSADESARIMAQHLRNREPFSFWRFGDGYLELSHGRPGQTCDGEVYTEELRLAMARQIDRLAVRTITLPPSPAVYLGDWMTASFARNKASHCAEWSYFMRDFEGINLLHFESLLLMRQSDALVDFYRAVKEDTRRKVFMGPAWNIGAEYMMDCSYLVTPETNLFAKVAELKHCLAARDPQVLLFGAGMAGNIPAIQWWLEHPDRTVINLGSAMDPLFKGRKTRQQQLSPAIARRLFKELL